MMRETWGLLPTTSKFRLTGLSFLEESSRKHVGSSGEFLPGEGLLDQRIRVEDDNLPARLEIALIIITGHES